MDATRFGCWTRLLATTVSRRQTRIGVGLSLGALAGLVNLAAAKKKRKKKKKIKLNSFGCVNVGQLCKNAGQCCSGICQGKKGKKRCRAHDTGGCQAGQNAVICGGSADIPCITGANLLGQCVRTTGNAGYCENAGDCFACSRDADCVPFCGANAACILCEGLCGPGGTACAGGGPDLCTFPP